MIDLLPPSSRGLFHLSVWHSAAIEVERSEYPDREPIQSLEIVDESGVYTTLSLGYEAEHEAALAQQFIDAFTDVRDHALATIAAREAQR